MPGRRGGEPSGRCCWPGRCGGASAERRRCGGASAERRHCGGEAVRKSCRSTRERTVRRILFAGFEALCVFGYLELVYHLLNLTIHKDRQVVG